MSNSLTTASVLAFERKLDPSDALFFSGNWDDLERSDSWQPVEIREKAVRGTISNRLKTKDQDPAKLDAVIENPNPQTVDVATLPADADTLKARFTLRVLAGVGAPSACNNAAYRDKLVATIQGYVNDIGLGELCYRYAANLANGRFLWRNRIGAEEITVEISHIQDGAASKQWTFDALSHNMRDLGAPEDEQSNVEELAQLIERGLLGKEHVLLRVTAIVRVGAGQEVFPSQELILDRSRGDKSKTLYHVNNIAAMHSQKVGNALRTVDTWYPGADENGPIAVEPYGSVTTQGKAWRQPKEKQDFYTLLDSWIIKDKIPAVDQQHFVIATLIRGGVFGEAGK